MVKDKLIRKQPFKGKIAIIPGGSKGMGKAVSKDFVKLGGSICVIARGLEDLKKTKEECQTVKNDDTQFIETISCDTTDMDKLKPLIEGFIKNRGIPDHLFNFVGYAYPQYIEKLTLEDFKKNMDVNYFGQLIPILIVLPYFMKKKAGIIAITSSAMGFLGFMGYATYAPSKYALFGLAEVLRNELIPYNINVSILFPVDTATPGFDEENKLKPPECAMMSEAGDLLTPEEVSEDFIKGIMKEKFEILPGKAKFARRMSRIFPSMVRKSFDKAYKKARKKLGKQ